MQVGKWHSSNYAQMQLAPSMYVGGAAFFGAPTLDDTGRSTLAGSANAGERNAV